MTEASSCEVSGATYCERYPDDGVPNDLAGYNAYHIIEDSELRVSQFVAPKSGAVGVFIGKQRNADSQQSLFELANIHGDALMKSLGFNPNQPPVTFHRRLRAVLRKCKQYGTIRFH